LLNRENISALQKLVSKGDGGNQAVSKKPVEALKLPDVFLPPNYDDGSIANIPATIAALLQVPFQGLAPLRQELWRPFSGRCRRVVVLLVDSLGWDMVQRERPALDWLLEAPSIAEKITSVFPSTTTAALCSLWTGTAPAQHGMVGLRLFFPDQAVLASMIRFSPAFSSKDGSLVDAGVNPEHFLAVPGFAEQLAEAGVPSHTFKGRDILYSELSTIFDRGVIGRHGIVTAADMVVQLRHLLEETAGQPLYSLAYWPAVDTLSHSLGPGHESVGAEIRSLFKMLKREFFEKLSPAARHETLFIITADHGHVSTPVEKAVLVDDHPPIKEMLLMKPAGEPRAPYLYARQGCLDALVSYLNDQLADALVARRATAVLTAGLLGPTPHAAEVARRLGDVVVITHKGHMFITKNDLDKARLYPGLHGSLTRQEMEVPWIAIHLDD
jgi:hypothetical protein